MAQVYPAPDFTGLGCIGQFAGFEDGGSGKSHGHIELSDRNLNFHAGVIDFTKHFTNAAHGLAVAGWRNRDFHHHDLPCFGKSKIAGRNQNIVFDAMIFRDNHRWIEERNQCSPELEARLAEHEGAGRTVTILANRDRVIALFAVADTIKTSSTQAIAQLKTLGVTPIMLTGDNALTAKTVGHKAGISEIRGNLLPEDKLKAIEEFQGQYGVTAMAGDGINDAPALAKSNIGFAMGAAGTHTAMEAADIVVMNDDLRRLPETIRLSKQTHVILWQNITLALGIKAVFLLMA
ncbi:MAG: HAD family hydrolase, partial [Betaproteobacteria bacterium]|nr:HAD family hydrolase [Betaproteobacteria bacterium]